MNSTKCRNCDLVNPPTVPTCRRCGSELYGSTVKVKGPREAARGGVPVFPIVGALIVGVIAYSYLGGEKPSVSTNMNKPNRTTPQPQPTLSLRSEYEQKQTNSYKTAIKNSPNLAQSQKRLEETQKLMRSEPAKTPK